jgi:Transposase DDE domain
MAKIAYWREVLKNDLWGRPALLVEGLSAQDLVVVPEDYSWRDRIWNPVLTFWTFLVQVLHAGSACREAVALVLAEQAGQSERRISPDASAYCQARRRVPLSVFAAALRTTGQYLQTRVNPQHLWHDRPVRVLDGSSCSMPDTAQLQTEFGQPEGQKPGCGFPVARLVVMFCWATGAVLDVVIGAYHSSELTLAPALWEHLRRGDIVLADRFYCTYVILAELLARRCDAVFRLHGGRSRTVDFRKGKRLGRQDRQVTWDRSTVCPRGLSHEQWMALPEQLTVRILRFTTQVPGFRSRTIVVATTLLDPVAYPLEEIAALYGDRWTVELRLRDIKTTMQMDVLRGKSPDIVRKEILMHLLAYNLIRALMWQAAQKYGRSLHRLSFAGTMEHLNALAPYLWLYRGTRRSRIVYALLLEWIARDKLPHRPGRTEPRAVKRRPKEYDRLNKPREELRQALLRKTG